MRQKVYLETSVVSYLTAQISRDLITAAHQQLTQEWWTTRRPHFDIFISELVLVEAAGGDNAAAERRLDVVKEIPVLELTEEAKTLAQQLMSNVPLPEKAAVDAFHIAVATVHGMDYLLTWNCTHIANATLARKVSNVCERYGYEPPILCVPEVLMGE